MDQQQKGQDGSISSKDELGKIKDQRLVRLDAYVKGKWVSATGNKRFEVTDPGTHQTLGHVADMDAYDVSKAVDAASDAFGEWSKTTAKKRASLLRKWYDLIVANTDDLARLLTLECGKPFTEAAGEVDYGASYIEWFAEEAKRVNGDVLPITNNNSRMVVLKQPVGVVGVVTPYNFPSAMITRKVSAALAAGCTVVIRPARETPFSALALCELAERAGIPPGVFNVVPCSKENTPEVGKELTTNPKIRKVSFTGSTNVGKLLMSQASSTMKKISMELGGNAPFIVFEDASIHEAAEQLLFCKFRNSGQTCVCANRIYVHDKIYDEFVSVFTSLVKEKLCIGHGLAPSTNFGPMITNHGLAKTEEHLQRAVKAGAKVVVGGKRANIEAGGDFFEPTVLVNVNNDVPMTCEETFSPLCPIYRFSSEEDVVRCANNVSVGLAGYFFSRDVGRIIRVAESLEVGVVGVNTGSIESEVAPFGGVKQSGVGREGSRYGIDDYLNIKYLNVVF
ncbi:aldehyde dehydrogenase domain-containing protein [Coemansia spiralis]|nr:aldehyde dehydrogenase domain-containing protein [Coemansia spiralis]